MPDAADIAWFKTQFSGDILAAIGGTPFSADMIVAVACQETGYIWGALRRKGMATARILELCVGDTIDGRSVFPRSRAELTAAPQGAAMFGIAHAALVDMAANVPGYAKLAAKPDKFCHGYGIFQYDIQFFKVDPDYFLQRRYIRFDASLRKCVAELQNGLVRAGLKDRHALTDLETAAVAIAYNTGSYKPAKGLKQGYFDGAKYYGENFFDFLRLAHTVSVPGGPPQIIAPAAPGQAIAAPPSPVAATGAIYRVATEAGLLRLRSAPMIDPKAPTANIIGQLPDGQIVRAVGSPAVNGFREVETSLNGAHLRGFAATTFLKSDSGAAVAAPIVPAATPPTSGIVAVYTPRTSNSVTRRTDPANAYSLNEPGQPGRTGTTPDALRAELAAIVDWLAVDNPANKRYQPRNGTTFCNIYSHDFCCLAGVYLPRVWWSQAAIEALSQGRTVEPLYGKTIDEERANDLFRWLRDFGPRFGWRQTSTLTKLQTEVNQGAIGLIVARRKEDGKSGHIVVVVPETPDHAARRNTAGEVIAPLQSQAGSVNFRYGTGSLNWWSGVQFAESAFWLHA